ncbi:MAG: hypothetical protein M1823_006540 [Watsoniomyces obsoletus]|nr:MAG: hypothetical protein M1823_006540 [Watsoniomyces obsoletus]
MVVSLARAGASAIAVLARSSLSQTVDMALAAAKQAGRAAPRFLELAVDMTDRSVVEEAAVTVEREFGRLDVLVNNAGYLEKWLPLAETDPEEWWRTWEVNLRGCYLMDRAFIPLLLKGGDKTIVTVTSAGGLSKRRGLVAYCIHPGGVPTGLALNMPKSMHFVLEDQPELAGDTLVWLTKEKRDWLADRYVSVGWDMEELLAKKNRIVSRDLLKLKLQV